MGLTDGNIFEIKDGIEMKFSNYNSSILKGIWNYGLDNSTN